MMDKPLIRSGGCLCNAVRFTATLTNETVMACHCVQCQRWTGGGPLLNVRVQAVEVTGEENIATYHASDWGERAFCRDCGATLYWRMQGREIDSIAVGLLDDQTGLSVGEEIFVDHRPGWLPAWDDATQSTEAQEQAKLAAYMEGQNAKA